METPKKKCHWIQLLLFYFNYFAFIRDTLLKFEAWLFRITWQKVNTRLNRNWAGFICCFIPFSHRLRSAFSIEKAFLCECKKKLNGDDVKSIFCNNANWNGMEPYKKRAKLMVSAEMDELHEDLLIRKLKTNTFLPAVSMPFQLKMHFCSVDDKDYNFNPWSERLQSQMSNKNRHSARENRTVLSNNDTIYFLFAFWNYTFESIRKKSDSSSKEFFIDFAQETLCFSSFA